MIGGQFGDDVRRLSCAYPAIADLHLPFHAPPFPKGGSCGYNDAADISQRRCVFALGACTTLLLSTFASTRAPAPMITSLPTRTPVMNRAPIPTSVLSPLR